MRLQRSRTGYKPPVTNAPKRPQRSAGVAAIAAASLIALGANGCSSSPDQTTATNVVLVGDSLADQAGPYLSAMIGTKSFTPRYFGGTEPCGWLDTDLGITASSIVVISFTGNSITPCMSDGSGGHLQGQALIDKYRSDVSALVTIALDLSAQVMLVGQPVQGDGVGGNDIVMGLNATYVDLARQQDVTFVDAGAAVENPDGTFASSLPCLSNEQECDPTGSNVVRNDDGLHFCSGSTPEPCAVYSSGAYRFARTIADAIASDAN